MLYESIALPLSYSGEIRNGRAHFAIRYPLFRNPLSVFGFDVNGHFPLRLGLRPIHLPQIRFAQGEGDSGSQPCFSPQRSVGGSTGGAGEGGPTENGQPGTENGFPPSFGPMVGKKTPLPSTRRVEGTFPPLHFVLQGDSKNRSLRSRGRR